MLFILFTISKNQDANVSQSISFLILFAGAGYKLNTAIGTINNSFLSMANVIPSLKIISNELSNYYHAPYNSQENYTDYKFKQSILFNNISFKYINNNNLILKNVNLKIDKGSLVGIVGDSGSGKSTIIDLILKLYETDTGEIKIDNKDIKKIAKLAWRNNLAYVGQNTQMLSGDIISNITLNFNEDNKIDNKILAATRLADIDSFIESLKNKFFTKINESGDNLSAGQKQRIAICRAIYKDPEILIFDEATNNLNPSSEEKILDSLLEFCKKNYKTLIHITHRIEILDKLDEIIFIKDGQIIGQDVHKELFSKNLEYKRFINKNND